MTETPKTLTIGIVMPISPIEDCSADHWSEVKSIILDCVESIADYKCEIKLVSDGDDVGVIHKRIIQGLYSSDVVICDVSCKNPNVMFELGMRLAFDKPIILIKDDKTDYSFDTGIIEHLDYPRDLRFTKIVNFKTLLASKVLNTYNKSIKEADHSPFLKNFGEFKVAGLTETTVTADKLILDTLAEIQSGMAALRNERNRENKQIFRYSRTSIKRSIRKAIVDFAKSVDVSTYAFLHSDYSTPSFIRYIETLVTYEHNGPVPRALFDEMLEIAINELKDEDDNPL